MPVTIYGASDDLIEIEGDIDEEWTALQMDDGDGAYVALSNGVVVTIRYTDEGVWRVAPSAGDKSLVSVEFADGPDDDNYSDRATVAGTIEWAVCGPNLARSRAKAAK